MQCVLWSQSQSRAVSSNILCVQLWQLQRPAARPVRLGAAVAASEDVTGASDPLARALVLLIRLSTFPFPTRRSGRSTEMDRFHPMRTQVSSNIHLKYPQNIHGTCCVKDIVAAMQACRNRPEWRHGITESSWKLHPGTVQKASGEPHCP